MIDKLEEICLNILRKIKLNGLADWYEKHKEAMRYLIFGALTTIVNILVYALCSSFILKFIENETLKVNISEIIAFIAGVSFAYITNKLYVFEAKTENTKQLIKELFSFIGCRVFTEIISIGMMNFAVIANINDILMKVISNIVVIILNFVFSKLIIFKKKEK